MTRGAMLLCGLLALVISGCKATKPDAGRHSVIVTPGSQISGKIASVNAAARYVVVTFPLGGVPSTNSRLNVYRKGLKVAELKVTGPQKDFNTVADILEGICEVGDDVKKY